MASTGVVIFWAALVIALIYILGKAVQRSTVVECEVACSISQLHRLVCNREKMNELSHFIKKDVVVETLDGKTKTIMKQDIVVYGHSFNPTISREFSTSNKEGDLRYEELEEAIGILGSMYSKKRKVTYEVISPHVTKYTDNITISTPYIISKPIAALVEKNYRSLGRNIVQYVKDKNATRKLGTNLAFTPHSSVGNSASDTSAGSSLASQDGPDTKKDS
ncbi:hypothetical protein, variant [Sphaeroforma arctica JP610]|nr:hypothetical protein, variant [Sphaeroforma arctica JP610]KNC83202.1 hypothetical protein, variant [Sphaeroforma arctica JP610]|eukprot:XP_014157104.1 hypothetical protein, variant [Sphaeroforma arctica JP610]